MTPSADDSSDPPRTVDDPPASYSEAPSTNGQAPPDGSTPGPGFRPFPLDALPPTPRAYAEATSTALDVAPAFVAVPMLSVLSAGVGASAVLQLKRSWREPATLWTAIVAPSGSTKSAALQHVLRPVHRLEQQAHDAHREAMAAHDPSSDDPAPVRTRYRTGDPTTEAVVRILKNNPQGVLLARDELAAWLGSFDRYAHGAADLQFWIEVWGAEQVSLDRVGAGNITIPRPAVPIVGTIQPTTLRKKMGAIHFESGFASRLLLCAPPSTPKRWTEADLSDALDRQYQAHLEALYSLQQAGTDGEPITYTLSSAAKERWVAFYNEANEQLHRVQEGPARAAHAKAINHAARLALIFQLCGAVEDNRFGPVEGPVLAQAVTVARWALRETLRVYDTLGLDAECLSPPERFLQRLPSTFSTAEARKTAEEQGVARRTLFKWLKELQQAGRITKVSRGQYKKLH